MKVNKMTFLLLLILPFFSLSEEIVHYSADYTKCVAENVNNPMSTTCFDAEIDSQQKNITKLISEHRDITSPEDGSPIDLNIFSNNQQKLINNRCSIWLKVGGQNSSLLEKQCILDETISLKKLLDNFVKAVNS